MSRGLRELKNLGGEGKGMIMLTAHVGCWQAAMAELYSLGAPVSLLLHREEGDVDRHYFEHAGIEAPFRIIDPLGYMGGVFEMMEVLKKGGVLSVMGDRAFGSDRKTVVVDFLGGKVKFPYSAFKLASATGAPLLSSFPITAVPVFMKCRWKRCYGYLLIWEIPPGLFSLMSPSFPKLLGRTLSGTHISSSISLICGRKMKSEKSVKSRTVWSKGRGLWRGV
jgi:hypothetical protein